MDCLSDTSGSSSRSREWVSGELMPRYIVRNPVDGREQVIDECDARHAAGRFVLEHYEPGPIIYTVQVHEDGEQVVHWYQVNVPAEYLEQWRQWQRTRAAERDADAAQ